MDNNRYKKPPLFIRIFLWIYGFLWLNMIFVAGLNSLSMGQIDYDSFSMFVAMTIGLHFIFKYLPKLL